MENGNLLLTALVTLGAATFYGFIGARLLRREVDPDVWLAARLFAVWWLALGASTVADGIMDAAGGFGVQDTAFYVSGTLVRILFICVALWGLLYYFLFLFTGRRGVLGPLTAFYLGYFILLVYYIIKAQIVAVDTTGWDLHIVYQDPTQGSFFLALLLLLILPQVVGALAYFTLVFRLRDPTPRYRISLVAWSIIIWFSSALVANVAGIAAHEWWGFVSRGVGLAAALMVFLAYYPPAWVRYRLGVARIEPGATL